MKNEDIQIFTPEQKRWNQFKENATIFLNERLPEARNVLDDEEALNKEILKLAEKKLEELQNELC